MSPARVFTVFALGFLIGVALQSAFGFSWVILQTIVFICLVLGVAGVGSSYKNCILVFFLLAAALAGFLRAGTFSPKPDDSEKSFWSVSRNHLTEKAKEILPLPESAIFNAMVFGDTSEIPKDIKNDFNRTGTSHILAISGMNISIVAMMLLNLCLLLGLWQKQAFWLAVLGVVVFVLLVGSPASAVRAGVMAVILLAAKNLGRLVRPWRPVILAAFFMVLLNPRLLVFNIGFQLSFLAVIGIMFFNGFWENVFKWVPVKSLRELISLSMAAQITTWPLILYNFGTVSVISPLANIFMVPLLNPIMFFGLGFSAVSFSVWLSKMFLWPVWLILKISIVVVEFFGSFSWASFNFGKAGLFFVFAYYPILFLFWKFLERKGWNDLSK